MSWTMLGLYLFLGFLCYAAGYWHGRGSLLTDQFLDEVAEGTVNKLNDSGTLKQQLMEAEEREAKRPSCDDGKRLHNWMPTSQGWVCERCGDKGNLSSDPTTHLR